MLPTMASFAGCHFMCMAYIIILSVLFEIFILLFSDSGTYVCPKYYNDVDRGIHESWSYSLMVIVNIFLEIPFCFCFKFVRSLSWFFLNLHRFKTVTELIIHFLFLLLLIIDMVLLQRAVATDWFCIFFFF